MVVAPQVEVAMVQAERLVDALLVELEGQHRRAVEQRQRVHAHLDLAGGKLGVHGLGRARSDHALHLDHELVAQLVGRGMGLGAVVGIEHQLDDAAAVAQVDEDQAAVIAARAPPIRTASPAAPASAARSSPPSLVL